MEELNINPLEAEPYITKLKIVYPEISEKQFLYMASLLRYIFVRSDGFKKGFEEEYSQEKQRRFQREGISFDDSIRKLEKFFISPEELTYKEHSNKANRPEGILYFSSVEDKLVFMSESELISKINKQ